MKALLLLLFLVFHSLSYATEKANTWTTTISQTNDTKIELLWERGGYEGFDGIVLITKSVNDKEIKRLKVYGQPEISENKKYLALKECWHGGCEKNVKVINLDTMSVEQVIDTSKGEFITLSWSGNILKVELFDPSPVDKVDEIIINYEK